MGPRRRRDLDAQDRRPHGERFRPRRPDRSALSATVGRPLRILFLDSWLRERSRGSGSAVAIAGLAGGLEALGHRIEILRPDRTCASLDLTRLRFNLSLPGRLRDRSVDLLVGFDLDGGLLPRGVLDAPYVVALKGVMADEARFERGGDLLRFRALVPLERRNARRADRVICTSAYSRSRAVAAYGLDPARVAVVPEGIDVPRWETLSDEARSRTPPPDGGGVILSVARQYRRKNTAALIRAFARVRAARPRSVLRIVGEGPELPRLRALGARLGLGDSVRYSGSLEGLSEIQAAYLDADAFCLPSRQEGFGIVFLEAMAARLPIVAGAAGAAPEVAPHGEVSLLVDPDDDEALASALLRTLSDRALASRLARGGDARWRSYDWPLLARRFLDAAPLPAGPSGPDPSRGSERVAPPADPPRYCAEFPTRGLTPTDPPPRNGRHRFS